MQPRRNSQRELRKAKESAAIMAQVIRSSRDDQDFALSSPVVIVGAGGCGLSAALAVRDAGVDALVLERDPRVSGTTAMSTGLIPASGKMGTRVTRPSRGYSNNCGARTRRERLSSANSSGFSASIVPAVLSRRPESSFA